jgi:hypothetical protein
MQQPLPTPSQPEPENKCLGCLFMKLEGLLVTREQKRNSVLQSNSATTEQINLNLTLQFNEQRELVIGGRIQFGLRGGQLKLKLVNGEIPVEFRKLDGLVKLSAEKQRQPQQNSDYQSTINAGLPENPPVVKATPGTNQTAEGTEKFQPSVCQVTTKGAEENPTWVFEVNTGEPVLKGLLKNVLLATLSVTAKPCCVEATFEVSPQDVYMIEAEGLWPKNISRKKIAVIERAIVRRFLERKLKPYVSRHELRYD